MKKGETTGLKGKSSRRGQKDRRERGTKSLGWGRDTVKRERVAYVGIRKVGGEIGLKIDAKPMKGKEDGGPQGRQRT